MRQAIVTVVTAAVIGVSALVVTSFQGHASTEDLKKVDEESKKRDTELGKRLDEHMKAAAEETRKQDLFRGRVLEALKIKKK